jgi:3-hydroxyisobutyrate dehydrogenase-like beta-hydroxyacid dehydrogenase
MARIGFVGLGTMGLPMSHNLIRSGHTVAGFDIDSSAVSRFVAFGGQPAESAADAALRADFVVCMLPNATHVRTTVFGDEGVAQGLSGDTLRHPILNSGSFKNGAADAGCPVRAARARRRR